LSSSPAVAQETTSGSIGGHITDAQGLPLPGVTVTLTSPQGTQTFVTDDTGRFYAPFLTPGSYTVRAEIQGFKPVERRNVEVRLGQRAELPLKLEVGGLTETVEVTAGSAVVDVTDSSAQTNIDAALLTRIPVQRRLSDTMYLAPGVSSGGGTGRANPSVSGASGLENQYIVDGVNITNPGYGALGSYSIVLGSLGTGVTFDFIQEVQVMTAGFEAQYGQATGGVVNVVTKTGANTLRGTGFAYFQPSGTQGAFEQVQSTSAARVEAVNQTGTNLRDVGVEVGGPIVHDRLFFFGAIDPQWDRQTFIAPEDFPLRANGDQTRERNIVAYSAKVTGQLRGWRANASFFGDPGWGPTGPQRRSALLRSNFAGFSELDTFGGNNQTLRVDGVINSKWLIEGSVSRAANTVDERPSENSFAFTDRTMTPNLRSGGIGFYENNDGRTFQANAMATNMADWFGRHQLRYGIEWQGIDYDNIANYSGTPFTLSNGQQTVTGATVDILPDSTFGQIYRVTRSNLSNVRQTEQSYTSVFLQDTWRIGDRVTVRPGVRYERQQLTGNLADFTFGNNWGPRIGATYDPTASGRMKIYANWGRFFAKIPNDLAARALSADAGVTRADYFDAALTNPIPDGTTAAETTRHLVLAGLSPSTFDDNAKSTYHDETLVGYEWEALPGIGVDIRYTHRNFGRVLEDVGTAPMVAYFELPSSQLGSVEYFITNPDTNTPVTFGEEFGGGIAFEPAIHDYDSLEIGVNRRLKNNWALQASYRLSRLKGTFEGFFRNDNGQSDPAITSLFDFPTNDPSYVALGRDLGFRGDIRFLGAAGAGPLPNDRRHQLKVFGNYAFNMGLNLGLGLNVASGRPLTALAANPVYESPGEIPETPRGDGFQTEDGFRTRTKPTAQVDLHADYRFPVGGRHLVLLGDVFNLFNTRTVTDYDDYTESVFSVANPDFGRRLAFQDPIAVRFGARFEF
jgi:outer membrane receptor protein involved in Fe transport